MDTGYVRHRDRVAEYFDRHAAHHWTRLTSDAPVGWIRGTVRAGRARMRALVLEWLPADLRGARVLDAGCGTGTLARELARRGAHVLGVDVSPTLLQVARELSEDPGPGAVEYRVADLMDDALGTFHYVVALDSLVYYPPAEIGFALGRLAPRVERGMIFSFAPRTALLSGMYSVGRHFPGAHRAPGLAHAAEPDLRREVEGRLPAWSWARSQRVRQGFYISQAVELRPR